MIEIFPDPQRLADAVARHVTACAEAAIAARGRFTVALSGGSTPRAAYSRLAAPDSQLPTPDWRLSHIFWGDERCVPPDDPCSNYRMAKEALLDRVPIPPDHIHRIRGEDDPETAAAEYERTLRSLHNLDLVLLGLGEDGHTASLFPGQAAVHETDRWVVAVPGSSRSPLTAHRSPDAALPRVTLTPGILNRARNITFVVSGANKAQTLQRVVEGPFNPDILPAQAIRPGEGRLVWMIDETAAGALRLHRAST
jgi:6-phosphogluconolactonase